MFRILVVDDECGRHEPMFRDVLEKSGEFTLICAGTPSELAIMAREEEYDGCIMDLYLWAELRFDAAIAMLRENTPVIVVSEKWDKFSRDGLGECQALMNRQGKTPIVMLASFVDFMGTSSQCKLPIEQVTERQHALCWRIYLLLQNYHGQSASFSEKSVYHLCHFADTQFGDPKRAEVFLEENAIASALRAASMMPDFVIVSGDIAFSGAPREYAEAETWFRKLSVALWDKPSRAERFVFAPGNHDVNYRVADAAWQEADCGKRKIVTAANGPEAGYDKLALQPYRDFCSRLSVVKDVSSMDPSSAVCNRFVRAGVQFFVLNTVGRTTVRTPKAFNVEQGVLDDLRSKGACAVPRERFVWRIAVAHNGLLPQHGNHEIVQNEKVLANFLSDRQIKVFLHGHGHRFSAHQVKASEVRNIAGMVQIMTPTLHTLRLPQDVQRGFSVVRLETTGARGKITVVPFFVDEGVIRQGGADVVDQYEV